MAGAGGTRRSSTGLSRDYSLKQPLRSPMSLIPQGLWVCGSPSGPSQAVGCWGQWGTCSLGLCLPVLGLRVPQVSGCPVPAHCYGAGPSCHQGKGISPPTLGPGIPPGCLGGGDLPGPTARGASGPGSAVGTGTTAQGEVCPRPLRRDARCPPAPSRVASGSPQGASLTASHQHCRCVGV